LVTQKTITMDIKEQIKQIVDEAEQRMANQPNVPVTERGIEDSLFTGNLLGVVLEKLKALL